MTLEQYAAKYADGPGAIYVGDINQLVGPAPTLGQGDFFGNVTLESLEKHLWIYDSPYYEKLLEKANLTNPTHLTSSGRTINIKRVISPACRYRFLASCRWLETYFEPNLLERTNGQVKFTKLEITEPSTMVALFQVGEVSSISVYEYAWELNTGISNLVGIYQSREQQFEARQAINDIEGNPLGVGDLIERHYGDDLFFFCKEKIDSVNGFAGKRISSYSPALSDWINGMGAEAHIIDFVEVYDALDLGRLDCGAATANEGYDQLWYELTDYIIGPLLGFPAGYSITDVFYYPEDLQQIIIEESAKSELEALRLAAAQNEWGLQKNIDADMEFVPFSEEINYHSLNTVGPEHVIPGWVQRVGNPRHPIIIEFNNKVGRPILGLRIRTDGTVVKTN